LLHGELESASFSASVKAIVLERRIFYFSLLQFVFSFINFSLIFACFLRLCFGLSVFHTYVKKRLACALTH